MQAVTVMVVLTVLYVYAMAVLSTRSAASGRGTSSVEPFFVLLVPALNEEGVIGRTLDVGVRIKTLNEKMDYASEIAAVLRERLSEKHSHLLEWIIIWLILIEVAYGSLHLWRERMERLDPRSNGNLVREYLLRELDGR